MDGSKQGILCLWVKDEITVCPSVYGSRTGLLAEGLLVGVLLLPLPPALDGARVEHQHVALVEVPGGGAGRGHAVELAG